MKSQEAGCGAASAPLDFAGGRSLGDAEQGLTIKSRHSSPANCSASSAGRPVSSPDAWASAMILRKAARLVSRPIESSARATFGGLNHLGDRQSEYRNDPGIAYLADEFRPERNQHLCQGLAIAQLGQICGYVQSLGTLADGSNQHFLFVANQRVKLSLRNSRARRDLQRAGARARDSSRKVPSEICERMSSTRKVTQKRDGKVVSEFTSTVSPDGKVMTNVRKGGGDETLVFERQ